MPRYSTAEIDLLADDPGPTFFTATIRTTWTKVLRVSITYA